MTAAYRDLQALLITEHARTGALLKQTLDNQNVLKSVSTIHHCKSAIAYLRKIGPYKSATTPDLVFFDFSDPGRDCSGKLQELVYGKRLPHLPVIVFITRPSQKHLDDIRDANGNSAYLAPLDLEHFLQRFRNLARAKFLDAARQLTVFGPIVVRLPDSFAGLIPDDDLQTA